MIIYISLSSLLLLAGICWICDRAENKDDFFY